MAFVTNPKKLPVTDGMDEVLDVSRTNITTPPIVNQPVELNAQTYEKPYQHSTVNTRFIASSSVITYIPGFEYTIDYYSQVLGLDEAAAPYNPTQLAVYQSYHLINKYQLKLQGELSKSFDDKDNTMSLTGNAIMYPFVIPNKGDMFIGDVGDGHAGLFVITRTEQLERYKQTCWSIDFILSRYMTKEEEDKLNQRVVKTSHFVKNRTLYGQDPVVIKDDYNLINELNKKNVLLMNQWLKSFYSYEYATIVVPYPTKFGKQIYDPFVMRAVQTIFEQREHPTLSKIRYYGCNQEDIDNMTDIFRYIIHRDKDQFYSVFKTTRLINIRSMHWDSVLHDIRYSRLSDLVYPVERLAGTGYGRFSDVETDTDPFCGCTSNNISDQETLDYYAPLSVHPVHLDGTYVLSKAFYDNVVDDQSKLEILIRDFMEGEMLNPYRLKDLHTEYHLWKPQEQFYYGIILYILTKGLLRTM